MNKEVFYLKVDDNHYKIIEKTGKAGKIKEIRLMIKENDRVQVFKNVPGLILDNYLNTLKMVTRKDILAFITENKLPYHLPEIQLSIYTQGKLF